MKNFKKDQSAKNARRKNQNKINAAKCRQLSNAEKKLMFLLMALSTKTLTRIIVISDYSGLSDPEFIQEMEKYHTAMDPDVIAPPVDDVAFKLLLVAYVSLYQKFKAKPQGATKPQVTTARLAVDAAYKRNMHYLADIANAVAIAAGAVSAGEAVVLRCGAALGSKGVKPPKEFKLTPGIGCMDIETKSVAPRCIYIRQGGPTTAENVVPPVLGEFYVSSENDIHIGNLKRNTMYGYREAVVLPVRRTNKTPSSIISIEKFATPTIATKAHKPVFNEGDTNYVWGPWKYAQTK